MSGPHLRSQPAKAFVESNLCDAIVRLNPDFAARPDRDGAVIDRLRSIPLAVRNDASFRSNEALAETSLRTRMATSSRLVFNNAARIDKIREGWKRVRWRVPTLGQSRKPDRVTVAMAMEWISLVRRNRPPCLDRPGRLPWMPRSRIRHDAAAWWLYGGCLVAVRGLYGGCTGEF